MSTKISPPIRKLAVIEEGVLVSMANNQAFLTEFPFLKALANYGVAASCNTCNNTANTQKATAFTSAKTVIANMGEDKKRKMKELLNAEKVRLMYKVGSKVVQHTF